MKKYVLSSIIFIPIMTFAADTLPSTVVYTTEQIVNEKVNKVNQQNQAGSGADADNSIFHNAESSHGVNFSSVGKTQQVGLDLHKEAEDLQGKVLKEQTDTGMANPQGCGNRGVLTEYQSNMCTASDTLQVMGIEAIESQSYFSQSANQSYQTMEDVAAFPLDGSGNNTFVSDLHGLPTPGNALYPTNQSTVESFHQMFKSLDQTSQYKGLKYDTKKDYFYLDGKKYPTSVLYSKDAMIKAGISKSLADFAYKMLAKKASAAQKKITKLLKDKNFYDGKKWNIVRQSQGSSEISEQNSVASDAVKSQEIPSRVGSGAIDLSSSLVEDKTLFKEVNGIPIGLSSDDIFKMVSRKYREKDRIGFFHNSPKK